MALHTVCDCVGDLSMIGGATLLGLRRTEAKKPELKFDSETETQVASCITMWFVPPGRPSKLHSMLLAVQCPTANHLMFIFYQTCKFRSDTSRPCNLFTAEVNSSSPQPRYNESCAAHWRSHCRTAFFKITFLASYRPYGVITTIIVTLF